MGVEEFLDFMPDTVTINAWTGQTVNGAAIYSPTGVTYPCRVELKNHLIIDSKGRTVTARGRIFLGSTAVPNVKDQVTLPSEYTPTSPPLLAVNVQPDEAGSHHTVLEIG